jgi:hypothetical protein
MSQGKVKGFGGIGKEIEQLGLIGLMEPDQFMAP